MRTCLSFGFENAEPEKACPLCGASEAAPTLDGHTATLEVRAAGKPVPLPSVTTSAVGRVYAERYRVDALIGHGGMGQVFRVRDLAEDADRALKVLHPSDEGDADRNERFKREIGILSKLRHPGVPMIHAWGTREG